MVCEGQVEILGETAVRPSPGCPIVHPKQSMQGGGQIDQGPGLLIGFISGWEGTAYREAWVLSLDPQDLRRGSHVFYWCVSLRTKYHGAKVQALRELEWARNDSTSLHNGLGH